MDAFVPSPFAARVIVKTTDGRTLERTVIDPHGTPADPFGTRSLQNSRDLA
jgi:hypothetical protein